MKTFKNLVFVALGSLALIGCSYFDTNPELSGNPPSKVDLTNAQPDMPAPTQPASLSDMIASQSKGSIEYYPPGGSGPALSPPGNAQQFDSLSDDDAIPVEAMPIVPPGGDGGGMKSLSNPNVEIFPLDEAMRQSIPSQMIGGAYNPPMMEGRFAESQARPGGAVVYFDHGSTSLNDSDEDMIASLAMGARGTGILVEGFASSQSTVDDPVMRKIINLRVSMERSLAVSRALIEKGIPADLITTVAYGEARPAETASESRRVEIHGLSGQ